MTRTQQVIKYLKDNPDTSVKAMATNLNIPRITVRRIMGVLQGQAAECNEEGSIEKRETANGFSLDTGKTRSIRTLDEFLNVAKIDRSKWTVERFIVNKYSVATKNEETGEVTISDLFQVKATLVPKKGVAEAEAIRAAIGDLKKEALKSIPVYVTKICPKKSDDECLLEISPFDLHLGKLAWGAETGVPYDAKISEEVFSLAIQNLWETAKAFPVKRVLLVLGQDFFTADNSADTTTAGTPQHVDSRFARNFRRGWRLMRDAIEFLRVRCPGGVDVLIVPGNHDTDTAYCAGEVLSALYEHTDDVRVDNGPSVRKYFRYGVNLLGFTHGDKEKHSQLPLLMANERALDWSQTTTREVHLGHLHHSRSTTFVSGSEHNSIRVRVLPSLSGTDSWHHSHGYIAKRAAEAYLWSKTRGYVGHLSWSP